LFDFDTVTAQIDLQYEDSDGGDVNEVEQAFVTYHFDNGGAITAGRYASMLGFEAFEPTGLYQYSLAYDSFQAGDTSFLPGYAQGVKYTQESDTTFFGISLQDEAFETDADRLGGDGDSSYAVEVAGSVTSGNGLTFFLGGAWEEADAGDTYAVNGYVTFETGAWLFAGELNYGNSESGSFVFPGTDVDGMSALVMANFAYSDEASVTGRLSYIEYEAGALDADAVKYTVAHNQAFSDNLLLVTELSYVDAEVVGVDYNELIAAVELLFTF
jgi:hypothetical protein